MTNVSIENKLALTIEEAAAYTNIGINSLRGLMNRPDFKCVILRVGRRILFKRKYLEEYLNSIDCI